MVIRVTEEFFRVPSHRVSSLPNKNKNAYNRLFKQLFQLVNNLVNGPNEVFVDFERSVINAFPNRNMDVQDCFYHHSANT